MVIAWMCCQCDFRNRDGRYCGGQIVGRGQIVYEVACGHGRCEGCREGGRGPQSLLEAQGQYQGGYQQYYPQQEEVRQTATLQPLMSDQQPSALSSWFWKTGSIGLTMPSSEFRPAGVRDTEGDEEYWVNWFTQGIRPPPEPACDPWTNPDNNVSGPFPQPNQSTPLPHPNPPPPPPPTHETTTTTTSPLQTYLTSRLKSQSTKPCVMTIGEYDKMMSGAPAYTPPVGYLADYAILTATSSHHHKEKEKDRKKREEMMRREEKASFGFAERVWRRHCDVVRVRDPEGEFGEGGYDVEDQGEEVKMELDEGDYARLQQISRRKKRTGEEVGEQSRKVKGKGKEREREQVGEGTRGKRDKGKGREKGQDYFTETVQGGQTWGFGGLDGGMDVDEAEVEGGGCDKGCYQATVEDGEEEL